jgi:hypothetical protein
MILFKKKNKWKNHVALEHWLEKEMIKEMSRTVTFCAQLSWFGKKFHSNSAKPNKEKLLFLYNFL